MAGQGLSFLSDKNLTLILFGGKGGVGKTTAAAATALYWAGQVSGGTEHRSTEHRVGTEHRWPMIGMQLAGQPVIGSLDLAAVDRFPQPQAAPREFY